MEYEVVMMPEEKILRKCPSCFDAMRRDFVKVEWIEEEMLDYSDQSASEDNIID